MCPLGLPTNWSRLTAGEQLFVVTDIERAARGAALTTVAANWIQGYGSPLEALYEWLYDDGVGSSNTECTVAGQSLSFAEVLVESTVPVPYVFTWAQE